LKHIISIEEGQAVYLGGKQTAQGVRIKRWARVPFSGTGEGPEGLDAALWELARSCRLGGKKALIVLPSQGVLFRELYLPPIKKEKQLKASLLNEMLYYHSNIDEYTVTYLKNGHATDAGQEGYFAYALRNTALEEIRQTLDKAKIRHPEITILADSLARLAALCHPDDPLALAVDLDEAYMELCLIDRGCCVLSRRIGLRYESFAGNLGVFAAEIADQIGRILQFQRTRAGETPLSRVLLLGSIPDLDALLPLLQAELATLGPAGLECSLFDFESKIAFSKKAPRDPAHPPKAAGALLGRK